MLSYKFLPKLHLQEMSSQDFIRSLKESKFGDDFTREEHCSRFLDLKLLNLSHCTSPSLVWLNLDSKHVVVNLSNKNWIKIIYCLVFQHRGNANFLLLSCFSLLCRKVVTNNLRTIFHWKKVWISIGKNNVLSWKYLFFNSTYSGLFWRSLDLEGQWGYYNHNSNLDIS